MKKGKFVKRLAALLLVCLMVASVAACGKSGTDNDQTTNQNTNQNNAADSNSGDSSSGQNNQSNQSNTDSNSSGNQTTTDNSPAPSGPARTLNVAASADSGTLHPLGVTGGYFSVLYSIYEPLWDVKSDGTWVWVLAKSIDRISDIQNTLHLQEGVKFSNGNAFTAEDVIFTMEQNRENPQFALNVKAIDFDKTNIIDDYTIDLWYTEFNAAQEVGMVQMLIMDKESYDEISLTLNPIGTGPYVVTDYIVNSHLALQARNDYWGGPIAIQNILYKCINEEMQIINALETGDVDMAGVPLSEVDFVESLGYVIDDNNAGMNYAAWYSMLPGTPLETKEARYAVSYSIDRQAVSDILLEGRASITDAPISHYTVDFEQRWRNMHDTYIIGYNPAKARELAEESGLVGKTLRLITNGASSNNTLAEIIQGGLLEIGVNVDIISFDQASFFGMMMDPSNFDIALFTPSAPSMMAVDILAMYPTFISLGWTGPERDEYGALSMGALTTADEATRKELLYEALKIFVDVDPWYGICELVAARARVPELVGVEYFISGNVYFQNVSFVN
ncbi:MAG: ABC transporter substrate-binding protein [Oscillospiraceae bacterium]|nr:ABC transporter substrate-binding protein [Oscillospiraceae bacterium]